MEDYIITSVGIVKDPMKHKIFMHNWSARWGNYHIDTWDQKENILLII